MSAALAAIRAEIARRGLSQRDVVALLPEPRPAQATVSRWLSGDRELAARDLDALARALGMEVRVVRARRRG